MANDIIRNYMRYLKLERNYTYNTLEAYRHDLEYLIEYARQNDVALVDMKLENLENFSASLHDKGIVARSQARILCGVRSFYRYLVTDGYIKDDPTELLPSPQIGEHLPEYLSVEEVDMLEAAIDLSKWEGQRNKAIIETLFSCGLRVTELVNLKISQIFEEDNQARRGRLCLSEPPRCPSYPCDDSHHDQECGAGCRYQENHFAPYAETQFCHRSAQGWSRSESDSGTAGTRGHRNHGNLYAY